MKLKASSMKSENGDKTKDKIGKTKIVVLGTGFAGSAFMEAFNRKMPVKNRDDVELIAVNHTNYLTFSPLLYEVATGQVYEHHISIPVCCNITDHGFRFLEEEIIEVNPWRNVVETRHGSIKYDHLVIALGTENNDFGIEGVAEHTMPLKTIKDGELIRNRILKSFRDAVSEEYMNGSVDGKLTFVIIGGGASGVELAASMKEYVDDLQLDYRADALAPRVVLIEAQDHLMKGTGGDFSNRLENFLKESGIELLLNAKVAKVTGDEILLQGGTAIRTSNVFWTAGVKSNPVAAMLGGSQVNKKSGRIIVDRFLRVPGFENITVIGDNALIASTGQGEFVPQTAAAAVQEGKYAGKKLAAMIREREDTDPFSYKDPGIMLSLGKFKGLCKLRSGIILSGFSAWLAWRLIHLIKISTFRNKVEVLSDWVFSTFQRRDVIGSQ